MTTAKDLFLDRPFLIYLAQLEEDLLLRLYESKSCVISVFRMLPPMAQKCFQHLLYEPNSDWKKWAKKRYLMTIYQNLVLLFKLQIVEGHLDDKKEINTDFRMNFISSLLSSPVQLTEFKRLDVSAFEEKSTKKKKLGEKDLLKKSVECWETVLRYLVSPSDVTIKAASFSTRELFQHVGFMGASLDISREGFHFLLLSRAEQIWTYVIYYLRYLEENKKIDSFYSVEFFLKLMLSVSPCDNFDAQKDGSKSAPISINSEWPTEVHQFLLHMREIGLIYMRKRKDGCFFLTPLLYVLAASEGTTREPSQTAVTSAKNLGASNKTTKGFLMIETNFKVFAYTDSTLQMAILSIFTSLLYRFHDVVVGEITRDSVRKALQTGVTAEQIVLYLKANAHPQSVAGQGSASCIPANVVDQIHLWEEERKRLNCSDGTLYSNFDSEAEFVEMKEFADSKNILQWYNSMQRLLVVTEEGHDLVKEWRKRQRNMC